MTRKAKKKAKEETKEEKRICPDFTENPDDREDLILNDDERNDETCKKASA